MQRSRGTIRESQTKLVRIPPKAIIITNCASTRIKLSTNLSKHTVKYRRSGQNSTKETKKMKDWRARMGLTKLASAYKYRKYVCGIRSTGVLWDRFIASLTSG